MLNINTGGEDNNGTLNVDKSNLDDGSPLTPQAASSGAYEVPAELRKLNHILNPIPDFTREEDVSQRIVKTERISEGTSESFWSVDAQTGKSFYLKTEVDSNKLKSEILADSIYKELGIKVPNKQLVTYNGKYWIASEEILDAKPCYLATLEEYREQLSKGFVADALLANRDVFGLVNNSNILLSAGQLYRVDSGATFNYRDRHGKKPYSSIACPEIDSMRNPQFPTGKLYEGVTNEEIALQVQELVRRLSIEMIRALVRESGIDNPQDIEAALLGRLAYLKERFVSEEGESELESLASIKSFPRALKEEAQSIIDTLTQGRATIESFELEHKSNFDDLERLSEDVPQSVGFQEVTPYVLKLLELREQLRNVLPANREIKGSQGVECRELVNSRVAYYQSLNRVNRLLGLPISVLDEDEEVEFIKRNIEAESIRISEELSSHVTGFEDLIKILQSGKLMSKFKQQCETGTFQAKVVSKSTSEMHQIVFDRRAFRTEYSAPGGSPKVPPVVFMVPSVYLLSNYQGMDSDGWHAFGRNHDEATSIVEDFSINVGNSNLVIMVPEEYREDLISELSAMASNGESTDDLLVRFNIVFLPTSCYREGVTGRLLYSSDFAQNPKPLQDAYKLARKSLPAKKLVRGRLLRNGNVGHGSTSWNKPLYQYVQASGQNP